MSQEGQLLDLKSLRAITGKTADWNEIAKDCIAFAITYLSWAIEPAGQKAVLNNN